MRLVDGEADSLSSPVEWRRLLSENTICWVGEDSGFAAGYSSQLFPKVLTGFLVWELVLLAECKDWPLVELASSGLHPFSPWTV